MVLYKTDEDLIKMKVYNCKLCGTTIDKQLTHHNTHLETGKHKDKVKIFTLELAFMTDEEKSDKYDTYNDEDIIANITTNMDNVDVESLTKMNKEKIMKEKKIKAEKKENSVKKKKSSKKELTPEEVAENLEMEEQLKITLNDDGKHHITNREALKNKIHEIHNFLRNNGAGYGMNALKVFNIIYGLKKIEDNGLFNKVDLSPECRFSYLLEIAEGKHLVDDEEVDEKMKETITDIVVP